MTGYWTRRGLRDEHEDLLRIDWDSRFLAYRRSLSKRVRKQPSKGLPEHRKDGRQ